MSRIQFHKIWVQQCRATRGIKRRFGVESALDYLIGEKLMNFADAAQRHPEFAAELPRFQAAVWNIFNPYELAGYVSSVKASRRKKLQALLYVDRFSRSRRAS
jgi:phosphopantothenate synthetase